MTRVAEVFVDIGPGVYGVLQQSLAQRDAVVRERDARVQATMQRNFELRFVLSVILVVVVLFASLALYLLLVGGGRFFVCFVLTCLCNSDPSCHCGTTSVRIIFSTWVPLVMRAAVAMVAFAVFIVVLRSLASFSLCFLSTYCCVVACRNSCCCCIRRIAVFILVFRCAPFFHECVFCRGDADEPQLEIKQPLALTDTQSQPTTTMSVYYQVCVCAVCVCPL